MYRTLQFPGGALTLLGVVVLSFLVPGLTARAVGLNAAHAQLVIWILSQHGLAWLAPAAALRAERLRPAARRDHGGLYRLPRP